MMEMNMLQAPGTAENALAQEDLKEDRQSNLSRNPQTFKEYKLTQSPLPDTLFLRKRHCWLCHAVGLEPLY